MDSVVVPVVFLSLVLFVLLFALARRYWPRQSEKKIYSIAFKMPDNECAPTTEARPQLLSLSGAEDELHFEIDD